MDRIDTLLEQWKQERPDLDATAMGIIGRLMVLNRIAEQGVENELKQYSLTIQEFDVLAVLRRCGPPFKRPVGELCCHSLLSSGAMTNRIDRLEKKELVKREPNPEDRRGVLVALTDKGLEVIDKLIVVRLAEADKRISVLSDEERNQLEYLLKRLLELQSISNC